MTTDQNTAPTHGAVLDAESEADVLATLLDNVVIAKSLSRELREQAHDAARSYLYDRRRRLARPAPEGEKCETCNGDGHVYPNGIGDGHNHQEPCPSCAGLGFATPPAQPEPGAGGLEVVSVIEGNRPLTDHTQAQAKIARLEGEVAERDARVAWLEGERRNIVSHATMGTTDGVGMTTNQISVEITRLRNDMQTRALSAEADAAKVRELGSPLASGVLTAFSSDDGDDEEVEVTFTRRQIKAWCALVGVDPVTGEALAAQTERRA